MEAPLWVSFGLFSLREVLWVVFIREAVFCGPGLPHGKFYECLTAAAASHLEEDNSPAPYGRPSPSAAPGRNWKARSLSYPS